MNPFANLKHFLGLCIKYYKSGCVLLVAGLVVFLIVNILTSPILKGYDAAESLRLPNSKLIYPSLSPPEINQLLHETWTRPHSFESFVQFKERPFTGKYVNVSKEGFRLSKNQRPWPPDFSNDYVVFVFGGSTTFGYGLSDEETVASCLQECMAKARPNVSVYNFACGFYYSSQERVLFEKLIEDGFRPHVAIFIDGLNDFYHTDQGPRYTEALRRAMDAPCLTGLMQCLRKLPLMSIFARLAGKPRWGSVPEAVYDDPEALSRCLSRYLNNKKIIEAVSKGCGVECLFAWQPVPVYGYNLGNRGFFKELNADIGSAHKYCEFGYPLAKQLYDAGAFGENFCWCAEIQRGRKEILYVDAFHYTAQFARDFATTICECISK